MKEAQFASFLAYREYRGKHTPHPGETFFGISLEIIVRNEDARLSIGSHFLRRWKCLPPNAVASNPCLATKLWMPSVCGDCVYNLYISFARLLHWECGASQQSNHNDKVQTILFFWLRYNRHWKDGRRQEQFGAHIPDANMRPLYGWKWRWRGTSSDKKGFVHSDTIRCIAFANLAAKRERFLDTTLNCLALRLFEMCPSIF